jgi:ribonucleoside-diphosphate reductase alpha chain
MKITNINKQNTNNNILNQLFKISILNSDCGEIPGNFEITTACLLGSINVTQYVKLDRTFDWEQYDKDVAIFARMLDNVIELQNKDLPAYLWSEKNIRQYGMGINGFGSMLYMMGIPYNSIEAQTMAEKLNKTKLNICLQVSAKLAKEKGTASMFNSEKYFKTNYWTKFLKNKLTQETIELVQTNGLRNLKQISNPPLGNSAVLCDNISNGLEPVFLHNYERTIITNWPEGLTLDNIKTILKEIIVTDVKCWRGEYNGKTYYYEPHNRGLCQVENVYDYGYKWVLENYPDDLKKEHKKNPYITTKDLEIEDHIAIQTIFQKYCDQSVSKTCNISKNYSFSDFKDLYLKAWKNNLIGFTTYREGTMESVLSKIEEKKNISESHIIKKTIKLPEKFINGPTHVIKREHMKFYIHFSYMTEDKDLHYPIAMWVQTNHQYTGEAVYVNRALRSLSDLLLKYEISENYINKLTEKYKNDLPSSKIAKLISMCLRHNLPITSIINALENLEGDNVSSLLTAIRKFLSIHIKDGTKAIGKICNNCKSEKIIYESGCTKCLDCGAGDCG